MAGLMEVLQVEPVVPCLVEGVRRKALLTALELKREDRRTGHQSRINATSQARHVEFQEERPIDVGEYHSKDADLFFPGAALLSVQGPCTSAMARMPITVAGVVARNSATVAL
jgi:hypothetical protein